MQQIDVVGDALGFGGRRRGRGLRRCGPDSMSGRARCASSVGEGRPYRGRDVAKVLGLPVVAALAWQEAEAAVFSRGAPPRRFDGRALPRSLRARAAIESAIVADAVELPARPDGEVLMGEPVFRDSSDPADLPLFTAVPTALGSGPFDLLDASRPGRHQR